MKLGLATLGTDRGWLNVYVTQVLFDLKRWKLIKREELMAEAAKSPSTRQYLGEVVGPRAAVVHRRNLNRLVEALGEIGIMPQVDDQET